MNFDDLFPPNEDSTGGIYTTGRSEQEPNNNMGSIIVLCLLLVVSITLTGILWRVMKQSPSNQEQDVSADNFDMQDTQKEVISNTSDFIVDYTFNGKSYSGFFFQPYAFDLPDGYILTSAEPFSGDTAANTPQTIVVTASNGLEYTAYFRKKNATLGVAILKIYGNKLPKGTTLCGSNSLLEGNSAQTFLYLGGTDTELSVPYEELFRDGENDFVNDSFLKSQLLLENAKQGTPIFNDAGQVVAIMAKPDTGFDGSKYVASIAEVNDWVWDTLQNPLRYIGIHGKMITVHSRTAQSMNSGFRVDYVEATKEYDLTDCLEPGDLILGFFDNYSLTRPNDLANIEALEALYKNFTDGKLVALSVYRSENRDKTKNIFLPHNTKR